jgi:hypothetical protein
VNTEVIPRREQGGLFDEADPLTPRMSWDQLRLKREWGFWNDREKEEYKYWLDLAKTVEAEDKLDHARFAAYRVLVLRRRVGTGYTRHGWRYE